MRRALVFLLLFSLAAAMVRDVHAAGADVPDSSRSQVLHKDLALSQVAPTLTQQPASINNGLLSVLTQTAPDAQITVIVTLREQTAPVIAAGVNRSEARQMTITERQRVAAATQATLTPLLQRRMAQNAISNVIPFWIFNGFSITATPEVIFELSGHPSVLSIAPNTVELSLAQTNPPEDNIRAINASALWSLGWRGQGAVVASLDTGVDRSHPDLNSRFRGGANSWFDPYGQHPAPYDANGHGTWTMGVMVGGDAGGNAIGVAPEARWIAARVFNDRNESTATAIHQAFQWLLDPDGNPSTDDAPDVVNSSWTLANPGCDLAFELDLQALRAAGILPIFAAGNYGPAAGSSRSPANNPSAFAVGAISDNDQLAAVSGRGPSACSGGGAHYPDLVAPGVGIRTSDNGGGYVDNASGTSLAAPHVAGGLALLLSAFPNLNVTQQEAALLNSAVDLGAPGADNDFGAGRLDLLAAYQWLIASGIAPQNGAPIVVNTAGDGVADDGLCSLREAVISANTDTAVGGCTAGDGGDTILFANSLPRPLTIQLTVEGAAEDSAQTGDLDIVGTLTIDGLGSSARSGLNTPIIVDGGGLDRIFDIQPAAHVTIQGVAIRNGNSVTAESGGGVRTRGELTLRQLSIHNNAGGGVRNEGGILTLNNVSVLSNTNGYGVTNVAQGALTVNDSALNGNQSGGLHNTLATATLNRVEVSGNTGSGLFNEGVNTTRLTVNSSSVMSNTTSANGGGLRNSGVGATAVVDSTRIAFNIATAAGGGVFNGGAQVTISNSLLDHNQARAGGGIDNAGSALTVANSTISANHAGDNGGGLSNRTSGVLRFVTLSDNSAGGAGGHIFNDEGSFGVGATIVANALSGGGCVNSAGFINSVGYNVEDANTCGFAGAGDLVNTDPLLGPLQDNSGPTLTHALRIDSPAINRVPAGVLNCGGLINRDQRGVTRPMADACDAGAYEATSWLGDITPIHTIQGAGHTSALVGATATTRGLVSVVADNGFFMEYATPDANPATSEGIFVTTNGAPTVAVGDDVIVLATVAEIKPGGGVDELTVTRLINPTIMTLSNNNSLPTPVIIGRGGRIPPNQIMSDANLANFDPSTDGLDFYESLEGMRVRIDNALVVGATGANDAIWVVADGGLDATSRTARGGMLATPNDANPEIIRLNRSLYPTAHRWPLVHVGAVFTAAQQAGSVLGVMDYLDAAYQVRVTAPLNADRSGEVQPETTMLTGDEHRLTIGQLNVGGLSGNDDDARFIAAATAIVSALANPDILVLEEVGDDDGAIDDGMTTAALTFGRLRSAVQTAGGPLYEFAQIDPFDAEDGGAIGRNLRLGIFYNPARVQFASQPGDAQTDNSVLCSNQQATLALNPGRIGAAANHFLDARKPLAAQFTFDGQNLFMIAIHLDSKEADSPRQGALQPPVQHSAARRLEQAQSVQNFVQQILACEPEAAIIVAGAPNDDPFSPAVAALKGSNLMGLIDLLSADAAYSEVSEGISRVAGQMFVSAALWGRQPAFDVVHIFAEFASAPIALDPTIAQLSLTTSSELFLPLVVR